jgi:hypothetical protein
MKRQTALVLDLKQKIQATLKLIALRVKSLVLQLLDLENQLEQAMSEQLKAVLRKYAGGAVRGSGLSEKNGYRKQSDTRQEMNLILKANGFNWVKREVLDIAQGETGEYAWSLEDSQGQVWKPLKALCHIYLQEVANLIPKRGGKVQAIAPDASYNIIKFSIIYGVV